jgi:predicted carbohydrate-binding protein with CBM48
VAVSTQLDMGALPFDGGPGFRVWAPFASGVAVAGSFNGWNPATGPLRRRVMATGPPTSPAPRSMTSISLFSRALIVRGLSGRTILASPSNGHPMTDASSLLHLLTAILLAIPEPQP